MAADLWVGLYGLPYTGYNLTTGINNDLLASGWCVLTDSGAKFQFVCQVITIILFIPHLKLKYLKINKFNIPITTLNRAP